jgi:serine phosphatase RsbU (regulator of sigma subunit)
MVRSDHVLLFTDGVWELLADEDGRAEARLTSAIERASEGGATLLDTILADVNRELAGRLHPDDVTLLTAKVVSSEGDHT